jgi:phage terminase large subunit
MNEVKVKLFGSQYDAFNFTTQFGAAVAGVQSGKTFVGSYWSAKKIQEFPDKNGVIVAPTYKILQQATLPKFFQALPGLRKYYKEQKGQIELPTGGVVFIRSADNPLSIEGITAHWIWLDEGGMTSQLTWTVLRSRVSMTGGQILITTTPYNMGWLYKDFYKPWKDKTDSSLSFYTWRSIDNPAYPKDYFEAERKRLTPQEFARRYCGEFQKMSGLIWDIPPEQIIAPLDVNTKTEARIIGVDWGFRNPAAIVVLYLKDNCWYVVDEWKQAEKTTDEIIQVLNNKIKEHKVYKVYADPAEPDRIEECKRKNIPVYDASKDVSGGISFVQTLIRERRLFICNNCTEWLDEASMYHWIETEVDKQPKEEPEKINDHLMDATRYPVYSFTPPTQRIAIASQPIKPYYGDRELSF